MEFYLGLGIGGIAGIWFGLQWGKVRAGHVIAEVKRFAEIDARIEFEEHLDQDREDTHSDQRWQAGMTELPVAGLSGRELLIAYGNKRDTPTYRKVKIESIRYREGYGYLVGWSYRESEHRHFNLDVVNQVADPVTKQQYETLNDWLLSQGMTADWSVIEESRYNPPDRLGA